MRTDGLLLHGCHRLRMSNAAPFMQCIYCFTWDSYAVPRAVHILLHQALLRSAACSAYIAATWHSYAVPRAVHILLHLAFLRSAACSAYIAAPGTSTQCRVQCIYCCTWHSYAVPRANIAAPGTSTQCCVQCIYCCTWHLYAVPRANIAAPGTSTQCRVRHLLAFVHNRIFLSAINVLEAIKIGFFSTKSIFMFSVN